MDADGSIGVQSFGIYKADWQKISAICQTILGSNGQVITLDASFLSEEDQQPEFCKYIQTNFAGKKACRKCHADPLCHLSSFPDVIDFKCHAGLNQVVIPFFEEIALLGPGGLLNPLQKSSLTAIADTLGLKSDIIFQNQSSINRLQPDIFLSTANLIKNILCETFDNLLRSKKRDSTVCVSPKKNEKYVRQISVSAIKSMTDHGVGASGSIELVGVLLAMENGFIPPTINLEKYDPECDLDYVPNSARKQKLDIILKNSLAFWRKKTSLVVGRY